MARGLARHCDQSVCRSLCCAARGAVYGLRQSFAACRLAATREKSIAPIPRWSSSQTFVVKANVATVLGGILVVYYKRTCLCTCPKNCNYINLKHKRWRIDPLRDAIDASLTSTCHSSDAGLTD